jgi:hypothetical protein
MAESVMAESVMAESGMRESVMAGGDPQYLTSV